MKLNPAFKKYFLPALMILLMVRPLPSFAQAGSCTGSLGDPIVNYTFGSGQNYGPALGSGITNMQYMANGCPNDGQYTITNYTSACFGNAWHTVTDHTGNTNGYFMLINASYDPSDFYVQQVDGLCSGTTYQFSAWVVNVLRGPGIMPNITFSIEKTDGSVLQSYNTGDIPVSSSPVWKQYGLFFTTPAGVHSVVIRMKNNAPGGNGNDIGLDDIAFRPAGPLTDVVSPGQSDSINVCHSSVAFNSNIESCYLSNEYQWQGSFNNGNWINIPGANTASYVVPVQPPGKYQYRLLVSQAGNIDISTCRVHSNVMTVVVVPDAIKKDTTVSICSGSSYILPSGASISTAGFYRDTARYPFGCDSLITNLQLRVQAPTTRITNAAICEGESYTLPSGTTVSSSGIYRDTLKYQTGCDSLVRVTNLTVMPVTVTDEWTSICKGSSAVLPWGAVVSSAGTYSDTTRFKMGCDSLIRRVHVHVTEPLIQEIGRLVCPNETYTLPSGWVVSTPGVYHDTLRTDIGCDSIITVLTLTPAPPPTIALSKSNDVNCSFGLSKLHASGGSSYLWSPAESLSSATVPDPVASPAATTVYHVTVTTEEGCVAEDSITVNVSPTNEVLIPNAFTPNNDGLNDCFGIRHLGHVTNLKFSVYNRWGVLVFYTTNLSQCWDGTYKGQALPSGVFVYQMSAKTLCGEVLKKGTVMLIR